MPTIQTRISDKEAYDIKAMADAKGLTTSALVRESLAEYIATQTQTPVFGCMAGKIRIADDFDELPEGFEEYV